MRRDCIEFLDEERIKIKNRNHKNKILKYNPTKVNRDSSEQIAVKVKNLEQLEGALQCNVDIVYYEDVNTLDEALKMGIKFSKKISYSAPRIIRHKEYKQLEKAKQAGINSVQVGSWGALDYFKDEELNIDYYLNAFNSETINHFKETGATNLCLSQELNIYEIKETLKYTDMKTECIVYGYTPLMITEYCPMGVIVRDCKKDKKVSKCKESTYALKDFKDEKYRITQDIFCRVPYITQT